jgi:hypothetical protein
MIKSTLVILLLLIFTGCDGSLDSSEIVETGVPSDPVESKMESDQVETEKNVRKAERKKLKKPEREKRRRAEANKREALMNTMTMEEKAIYRKQYKAYRAKVAKWRQAKKQAREEFKRSGDERDKIRLTTLKGQKPVFNYTRGTGSH